MKVSNTQPDLMLSLLQRPGLLLIGINPETHEVVVWSGRQATAVVAADLEDVILRATQADPSSVPAEVGAARLPTDRRME
jgi:hypothetical protein